MADKTLKPRITPRKMVFDVLSEKAGLFLSVSQIRSEIFEKFCTSMDMETIVNAIDEINYISGKMEEVEERRGDFKQPVKVFRIQYTITP